ncbi:hypothetical protein KQX54_005982 [Cotesia glomerata]|uniref:Uncharacterized protein n=1 Tax=Cotesia glomerata TaxID=32391 RepID=A0AAV7IMK0_COTGL|nr:hypothetical protein KQX54_005982 [Cotesia glomerata]
MNRKKRPYESKSTDDLTELLNSKKLKELERLTNTYNFDKFFELTKKKAFVPNLQATRSRSNSTERPEDGSSSDVTEKVQNEFKTPRKFIKRRLAKNLPQDGACISTENNFEVLEDMSIEDGDTATESSQRRSKITKKDDASLNRNKHNHKMCGKNHGPIKEGAKCEIEAKGDKNLLKCNNCGENDHTASYFGCIVNPEQSFANIANNSYAFLPLPTRNNNRGPFNDQLRPQQEEEVNNQLYNNPKHYTSDNNITSVEAFLNQFKTSIMNILTEQFS